MLRCPIAVENPGDSSFWLQEFWHKKSSLASLAVQIQVTFFQFWDKGKGGETEYILETGEKKVIKKWWPHLHLPVAMWNCWCDCWLAQSIWQQLVKQEILGLKAIPRFCSEVLFCIPRFNFWHVHLKDLRFPGWERLLPVRVQDWLDGQLVSVNKKIFLINLSGSDTLVLKVLGPAMAIIAFCIFV